MQNECPGAQDAQGVLSAPLTAEKAAFSATKAQWIAALITLPLAFGLTYVQFVTLPPALYAAVWGGASLLFAAAVELVNRGRPRTWECWIFMGCYLAAAAGVALRRESVWPQAYQFLFQYGFGIWYALHRADALLEKKTGRLLPLDAALGALTYPIEGLSLLGRTLSHMVTSRHPEREKRPVWPTLGWCLLGAAVAAGLFAAAAAMLVSADDGFARLVDSARGLLSYRPQPALWQSLILSLPASVYLFGLIDAPGRRDREAIDRRAHMADVSLGAMRRMPPALWSAALCAFALMYLAFFCVQGGYLFGAFTRTLPEGFIVSQYARKGFFELCGVMALNFGLMWLANRLSLKSARENKPLRFMLAVLILESMLFAVVALSKLYLYIDCFGFTPLRLQSTWLACVLLCGALCALIGLLTRRDITRPWVVFASVTLALLCLW